MSTSCKKNSTVKNAGPSGGPLPRGESPEEAVIRAPCPSPCSPWRLPLLAAGALARCPPLATALRDADFGVVAAGCVPAAAGAFPAAACGFPTATAGTSGGVGGPPHICNCWFRLRGGICNCCWFCFRGSTCFRGGRLVSLGGRWFCFGGGGLLHWELVSRNAAWLRDCTC